MKRKIFSILFALVLVLSFSIIPAMPAMAGEVLLYPVSTEGRPDLVGTITADGESVYFNIRAVGQADDGDAANPSRYYSQTNFDNEYFTISASGKFLKYNMFSGTTPYWGTSWSNANNPLPDGVTFSQTQDGDDFVYAVSMSYAVLEVSHGDSFPVQIKARDFNDDYVESYEGYEGYDGEYSQYRGLWITDTGVFNTYSTPSEVWVDNGWATLNLGDPADGHTFGYDAFATIQDGIDAVAGSTVNVAAGTYTIISAIDVNKGVTITGDVGTPANVVVQYNPASTSLNGFEIGAVDITIQGFKIIDCFRGVHFDKNDVTSTGCTITNCAFDNIHENAIGEVAAENTTISNNAITNCTQQAIEIRLNEATSLANRTEVTGNTISSCSQACIQTFGGKYVYIYNNTITSTDDKGINIIGSSATSSGERIQVVGNNISGTAWEAILLSSSGSYYPKYTYVHGNTISNIGRRGIYVQNVVAASEAERVEVSDNTISSTYYPGIDIDWSSPYTYVYDNTLTKCNYYGADGTGDWDYASIHVGERGTPCHHTVIDNNTVSDGINGIQIWADNCTVTNNTIYDMGLTYNDTKGEAGVDDGVYYNSGIIIGSNWLTDNNKPTGTTITGNSIHDNYWGLYVRDYATLSPGDSSVLSVTAEKNWWGAVDGPSHSPGSGDNVSANVDYSPWLGATPGTSPMTWGTDDSIQDAINAASAGDTINVAAGTYYVPANPVAGSRYKNHIWIYKPLSLIGEDPATTIIDGEKKTAGFQPGWSDPGPRGTVTISPVYTGTPGAVTVKNFTFINATTYEPWNEPHALVILQSSAQNGGDQTIENCRFIGRAEYPPCEFLLTAWGLRNGKLIVKDNEFSLACVAISEEKPSSNACEAEITGNYIHDVGSGINLHAPSGGPVTQKQLIVGNTLKNCVIAAITIGIAGMGDLTDVEVHFNNITGSGDYGINNRVTSTIDATDNWWGDASGPYNDATNPCGTGDNVSANVDYDPWLTSSYPSYGVSISATPTTKTVDVNTNATYTITIENTGNAQVQDTFELTIASDADNAALTSNSVSLDAGASTDVTLTVNDSSSGTCITTVTATSTGDASKNSSVTVTTEVTEAPVYGVSISSNVSSVSVEKNEPAAYNLTITNTGNQPDIYTLSKSTEPGITASLTTTSVTIPAGGSVNVILTVRGSTPREDYVTQVTASSPHASASVQVKTTVIKAVSLSVDSASRSVSTGETATYIVTLENTGNKQHKYDISESEPVGTLNKTTATLDVGESSAIELNVTSGTEGSYVVTVTAETTTAGGVQDQASITTTTTVSTAPVYGVALGVDTTSQSVNKNEDASYTITIENTGNRQDTYDLLVVNTMADSAILSGAATETIDAGASATRTLNVKDSASGTYDVRVIAVSHKDASKQDSITTSTLVKGYGVLITADTLSQTRKVNNIATYTLTIKNTGNTVDSYALSAVKNSDTASMSKSDITSLAAGATDTVTLTVIDDTDGTYFANVTATSVGNDSKRDYVNLSTTFTPLDRYGLELSVSPTTKNVEIDEDAVYIVSVKNTGNVPDTFGLTKSGEGSLSTSTFTLLPGETGTTTLTVSGTSFKTYTTTITATSQKDPAQTSTVSTYTTVVRSATFTAVPASQAVYLGNASEFILMIKNTGTVPHTYDFSVESEADTADLNMNSIYLTSGSSSDIILTMNHSISGMYTAKVTATVSGEPDKNESITVRLLLHPPAHVYGVQLLVDSERQAIEPGKYALYLLTIRNIGNQEDTFTLTKTTDEPDSAVVDPTTITLNASGDIGDTGTATLNVTAATAGEYRVEVEARCDHEPDLNKDSIETTTRVIETSGNTITDSEIDEYSTVTNSIITRSTIVRSLINPSTITDSEITDSTIRDSTVTDTVLEDVTLENNANVRNGTICNGNITISGTVYVITEPIRITDIVAGSDEMDSNIAGAEGGTTTLTSENTDSEVTIGNNESYVGGTLTVHKSTAPPSGVPSFELLGGYVSFEASDNIEESLSWIIINLTYDPADVPAGTREEDLRLTYYNTTTEIWETLRGAGDPAWCYGAGVDTSAHIVWTNVSHFSTYAIRIVGAGPAVTLTLRTLVSATDFTTGPDSVPPGEFIWVLFNHTNATANLFDISASNWTVNVNGIGHNYSTIGGNGTFYLTSEIEIASFSVTVTNAGNATEYVTLTGLSFVAPPLPLPVPEFNAIGLLALIGVLSVVLATTILRRKE